MSVDEFRAEIRDRMRRVEALGGKEVQINSGEVHRKVGGYPGPAHRMPVCCDAMYAEQREGDEIVTQPPKGKGASLTIRYVLPRPTDA